MRCVIAATAVTAMLIAAVLLASGGAQAERRVFIIANSADGYGVDQCLATGAQCGKVVANSYCRSRQFARAVAFRNVGRDDITGAIPAGANACHGNRCNKFIAIECSR
jgi:hypothetical protein